MSPLRVTAVSVVPSPYQRDLFAALAARPEIALEVLYLEKAAADSPWPEKPLAPYERILPGFHLALGSRRIHGNLVLPLRGGREAVILNTLMSATAQWLMRTLPARLPWCFWGERLGHGGRLHRALAAPLNRARAVVGIGTLATQDYAARFPRPRSFNIPYHCELSPFFTAPRPARKECTFLFCGQMIARKGVDLLLRAFAELPAPARLLLVGREAELPGWLAALPEGVRARIEYAGFQAPEALPPFFARADVFLLPSRYDGWGVVVNQALAAGLPIITTTAVGAAYDLVEEGRNGLVIDLETTPAEGVARLAAAMRRLLLSPEERRAWGARSRALADDLTPAAGAAKWVEVLQTVTSGR